MKKIIVTTDWHTGHRAGLTPPKYQSGGRRWVRRQAEKWEWFKDFIKDFGPFDAMINLGDMVDGMGVKDSTETIFATNDQIASATEIVETINAPVNWFCYGTRVHTTTRDGTELEKEVAKHINGKENPMIYGQFWVAFDDWVFDCRHAPASKAYVQQSRPIPLMKERLANVAWAAKGGQQPLANHYFRGHVHHNVNVGEPGVWQGLGVPALQDPATKYGRTLSNIVDCGCGFLTIKRKGWPVWKVREVPPMKEEVFSLFKGQTT